MNSHFIQPLYDSLLRGKDYVFARSALPNLFETVTGQSVPPQETRQHDIPNEIMFDRSYNTGHEMPSDQARGDDNQAIINREETPENERVSNEFVLKTHNVDTTDHSNQTTPKQMPCPTTIRHLVISGGGEMGFSFYSALRESNKSGFWNIENIETIYCTSVGSMFAIITALLPHFGWDIYDDFLLKRPWQKVFNLHFSNFTNSFYKKGVFTKETIHEVFNPIFNAIDLPINITLQQFYEYTNIEIHIMATELTQFKLIDLSHKTHPEWELLDAVYCSCGLPIFFAPHCIDNHIYLDGGFISNYPINRCLEQVENPDEIMGFKRTYHATTKTATPEINTLADYLFFIIYTIFSKVSESPKSVKNQVEVRNHSPTINFYKMYNAFKSYDERVILLEDGVRSWEHFYETIYGNQ
jgi:predicted acylesterase/phospholipase RssA